MINLEQLRAAHALKWASSLQRKHVDGIPALILNNGLLSATAFALDEKRAPMAAAMDAVADHLAARGIIPRDSASALGLVTFLSDSSQPVRLQLATVEALAYLGYLKRFAKPEPRN